MPPVITCGTRMRVEVPASSANLGPGFDSLGLGIELRDVVDVEVIDGGLEIEVSGAGAEEVPTDERHLVYRSMLTAWERIGVEPPSGLRMRCSNLIPHSRGLGSSASAIVAGVTAAVALTGDSLDEATLAVISDISSALEGHPDNASASVYGGFTVSWWSGDAWLTRCPTIHPDIDVVAFVPEMKLSTDKARSALPQQVPLADAAANAGRAALLVHAMTVDPAVLHDATADWLHQENRRPAYPQSMALVDALRADGHAAFISGAGPTVLVLGTRESVARIVEPGEGWAMLRPGIARDGVRVVSHNH